MTQKQKMTLKDIVRTAAMLATPILGSTAFIQGSEYLKYDKVQVSNLPRYEYRAQATPKSLAYQFGGATLIWLGAGLTLREAFRDKKYKQ